MYSAVVLSLALGLSLTIALASIADAIFFHPLPIPDAGRAVRIPGFVSYKDFEDLKSAKSITGMVAQTQVLLAVGRGDSPKRVRLGLAVTGDYFDALGVRAQAGRVFHREEARDAVVVLSDGFWRAEFGGDRGIIGREIRMGSASFTIVGIAPEGFGLDRFAHESFYIPMHVYEAGILPGSEHALEDRRKRFLNVIGRLTPGVQIDQARAEIATLAARLEREYHVSTARDTRVLSEMEWRADGNSPVGLLAWIFVGMAGVILLISCANASGFLLAHAEQRSKEIALRMALGATWTRLLAGFAREAIAMSVAGEALGLSMAWAVTKMLARAATLPTDFSLSINPRFDARIAIISTIALAIPAVACWFAQALMARRIEIGTALKSRAGWRGALVTIEIAVAGALAMVCIALVGAVAAARRIDPGYRVDKIVVMAIDPVQNGYTKAQARAFFDTLLDRAGRVARVRRVALAQSAVLGYVRSPARVEIEGETIVMWMNTVTDEYFSLMRLAVIAGRAFDERDTESSMGAAIVNEELAKRAGIGATIQLNGRTVRVVGIARNARYFDVQERIQPHVYVPFRQNFGARMVLHAEIDGAPSTAIPELLAAIRDIDPGMAVSEARPLKDSLEQGSLFSARAGADVIGGVGLCAIGLALGGVYGMMTQYAGRKRQEIGIRAALGASQTELIWWLMRRVGGMVASGSGGGIVGGIAMVRVVAARVSGIEPFDWMGLLGVGIIAAAAILASLIPATRATRTSPTVLLRT